MKAEATFPMRRIWLVSALLAVCLGVPISFFCGKEPWLIAIPILTGTMLLVLVELIQQLQPAPAQLPLVKAPSDFLGLSRYKGHIALWSPVETEKGDQWTFAFLQVPKRNVAKTARLIRDPETGDQIYLIDTERFVSLLLKDIAPNTDKIAEFAIKHAIHRYGEMEGISEELEKFLSSKTTLEVLKTDIKSNTAQTINNSSEAAIRELVRQLRESKRKELQVR